jgi:hypothetical protein
MAIQWLGYNYFSTCSPNPWISVPKVNIPRRSENKKEDVGAQPHFAHIKGREIRRADGIKIEI